MVNAINKKDDSYNYEQEYREFLDEWGSIKVAWIDFEASEILEKLDNTAYRTGLNDFADNFDDEWVCDECWDTYDNELEAEECCMERTDEEIEEDNREV